MATDTIYEAWEARQKGEDGKCERIALRIQEGRITGVYLDTDGVLQPHEPRVLPTLTYAEPWPGIDERAQADHHLWIVIARWVDFVSATPPPWVLERQRIPRSLASE